MKKAQQREKITCGSCSFLVRERTFEKKCSELGKLPSSRSCSRHSPDAFTVVQGEPKIDLITSLASNIAQMSVRDLEILAGMFLREKLTRRFGFTFFQKVYIRFQGNATDNFFSNFVIGYVLDANKDTIRVISETGKTCISVMNDSDSHTFYTAARFNPLRKLMSESRSYVDPKSIVSQVKVTAHIAGLDDADRLNALEGPTASKKRIKKEPREDVFGFITRMNRGIYDSNDKRSGQDRRSEGRKSSKSGVKIRW